MISEQKLDSAPITQTIAKLERTLKQLRECGNKEEQYRRLLDDVLMGLQAVDVQSLDAVSTFIYDILKPITREITNFYPHEINTFQTMKSTILSIIKIYMQIFSYHHFDAILEIMKQLLQRENMLFVRWFKPGAGAGVPVSEVEKMIAEQGKCQSEQEQKKYQWSRGRLGYTTFHRDCCQTIYSFIMSLPCNQFHKMRLCSIKQLMSFMVYFEDFIYQEELQKFILQSYQSLRKIFTSIKVSKELIKQSTKEILQQISQKMTKMLFYHTDKSLKQGILLLGPQFAVTLLVNAQTIETKLHALRILQKFAQQYYYRGVDGLKEDVLAEWLLEKGLWEILIGKHAQWAVVKSCEYVLKMIVNKKSVLTSQQKFKQFLALIWQTTDDIRKRYLKALDPLRLSYTQLINLIQNFKIIQQNGQLYNDEFFYLVQQISRYGVDSQRRATVEILVSVMKRHYLGWKMYSTQRKALDSLKYCFEKLADAVKDTTQRGEMYVNVIESFNQSPDYLTLSISRKLFQSQEKKNSYALEKAAKTLVEKKHIIETIIQLMSQQVSYNQQLLYFLKAILEKYKSYNCTMSLTLPEDIMIKATKYPQVFTQLVNFSNPKDCQSLLQKLLMSAYQTEINFESIKQLFYKVNYLFVKTIQAEYFRRKQYRVKINPEELYFIKDLQIFLVTSKFTDAQEKCAELIASVYTSFSEGYMEKGRVKMRAFMQEILERIVGINLTNEYFDKEENKTQLYGLLCLVKELLQATETQGVGELKAHNALVTTSMLKVKIWNNAAYGDDVQKCFQKTVPSNMTLFQLLTILSDKFKCGQHELYLQQGNNLSLPSKLNGLTLLELGFNQFKQYSAYKNTKVQIKKQPLKLQNNQLNPLFLNIIKQIFHTYSHDNKMGEQQIINYIRGVTNSTSHNRDSRVLYLLKGYDLDNDGYLTEEDLIRFYGDSCDGGEKEDNVWGNLANLHYRNDLRKFNQPIGPVQQQDLFKYYLKSSQKTYELLFSICHLKDCKLVSLAKQLLGHLPTCQTLVADFDQPLNLQNKSSFQISYILINVRYFLQKQNQQLSQKQQPKVRDHNSCDKIETQQEEQSESMQHQQEQGVKVSDSKSLSYMQKFLKSKNDLIIFALIQSLSVKQHKEPQQQLLIAVSLNILRTLLHMPILSQDYLRNDKYKYEDLQRIISNRNKLNIENYTFFIAMISQSMKHANFAALQPALALSLNKQSLGWQQWMYQGLFHQQNQIRKLTLNFLLFYCIENDFPINFFQQNVVIVRQRSEEWFMMLLFYVHFKKAVTKDILERILKTLAVEEEEIAEGKYYNPIMNGNLSLLFLLINTSPSLLSPMRVQIYKLIEHVIARTLSNQNRFLCYQIMTMINHKALFKYMYNLIRSVKPTDTYQPKQNFVGIKNLGSTCYMNSILQQFFTISKFKKMVLQFPLKQIPVKSTVNNVEIVDDFLYQLQRMYTYLQLSKKKYYVPRQFCLTIKDYNKKPINTSIQEDAHEFLNNLFDKIETYMKQAGMLGDLQKVFQGKTVCEICCKECNTKKSKIQDFYHLALEVKNVSSLEESFRKFILPQTIQDYYCEKCEKKSQQITKQTLINALPQVLIVNLQRIVFDLQSFMKVKVHSKLQFPAQLKLHQFIHSDSPQANNSLYRLKGVVIHSGTSQGGHYYSLIKVNNEWYKFNDETVSSFAYSDLQRQAYGGSSDGYGEMEFSTNAYILFYERVQKEEQLNENVCKQEEKGEMESEVVGEDNRGQDLEQQLKQQQKQQPKQQQQQQPQQQQQQQQQQQLHPYKSIFKQQILQQNNLFYKQLQLHQQSFFNFIITIYPSARPAQFLNLSQKQPFYSQWKSIAQLQNYQMLFKIFMQMLKFMRVFCDLPRKILTETGQAIYELLQILPEETYELIHCVNDNNSNMLDGNDEDKHSSNNITIHQWVQTICTHSQITIRELYKVVLNKILFVYVKYYGWTYKHKILSDNHKSTGDMMQEQQQKLQQKQEQQRQKSQQDPLTLLLQHFIHPTTLQTVTKNLYKSYYYFQFWSVNIQMDINFQQFCLQNNFLFILLDILMGNESPYANKDKKRQDLPYEMAPPLLQCVLKLLYRKRNCANAIPFKQQPLTQPQYYPLTQQQSTLLTNPSFYKRMIRLKYDNGILSQIIHFMSIDDKQISANFCQLLLVGLNNIDEIENSLSLLNNIKSFLLISDDLQQQRTKWMLGIPQFDHAGKMSYGLKYSNQSFNIVYVSSRYFIADQKYKPALQVLHDKRCYFSDFEVNGIMTLLQIALNNEHALKHLLSIPPPSYLYHNYISWIVEYSNKLSNEDHYGLTMDKKLLAESLENLIKLILKKIQTLEQQPITPILPKIIGRNKILSLQQEIENQVYSIRKYVHETYVLQNLPLQNQKGNLSLPDDIFSIKQPKSYAVRFIQNTDISEDNEDCTDVQTEKTVITLEIDTKKPLKLTFSLPNFDHQIHINKGKKMMINYPYTDFPLQGYLEVEIKEQSGENTMGNTKMAQLKLSSKKEHSRMQIQDTYGPESDPNAKKDYQFDSNYQSDNAEYSNDQIVEIQCPVCTFYNDVMRTKCEMCDSPI